MTNLQARSEAYLAKWQPRLGLQDWRISVKVEPLVGEKSAHMEGSWTHQDAVITVRSDFEDARSLTIDAGVPPERALEETIIHELLHMVDQPMQSQVENMLTALIGESGTLADRAHQTFSDYLEWWVNRVTRALLDLDMCRASNEAVEQIKETVQ